jgi:hypothetical protein
VNPAKRLDLDARRKPDQTQRLAATISIGDKSAFNIFCEIHSAQILLTFIHFKYGRLRLITLKDIAATKGNCTTEAISKACASLVTRRRQRNLTEDLALKQYLFQSIEQGRDLNAGRYVWRGSNVEQYA